MKQKKCGTELQTLKSDSLWPKLSLYAQQKGLSVRQIESVFNFVKQNVEALVEIKVPGHSYIHDQRNLIPTLCSKQRLDFINNAKKLSIAIDGTEHNNNHYMAVVLFNENNDYILFGMDYYIKSDNKSLTEVECSCPRASLEIQMSSIYNLSKHKRYLRL